MRRAILENRNMARILAAQPLERKRCTAASLIWINIAEIVPEQYYSLGSGSEVIGLTRHARLRERGTIPPR